MKDFTKKDKKFQRSLRTLSKKSQARFIPKSGTGKCLNKQAQGTVLDQSESKGGKKSKSSSISHDPQDLNYKYNMQEELNLSTSSSSSDDEESVLDLTLNKNNKNFSELASFDEDSFSDTLSKDLYSQNWLEELRDLPSVTEMAEIDSLNASFNSKSCPEIIEEEEEEVDISTKELFSSELSNINKKMICEGPDIACTV